MDGMSGIFFAILVVLLVVAFYLGVPTRWFKNKRGRDLGPDGTYRQERRRREQH